ncbi:MAG: hypothetical protein J6Q22_09745 [Prevotella sp.]|nr:hypothetical protein [Prevotella sp.]
MKSLKVCLAVLVAAVSVAMSGCKKLPTADVMKKTATSIGVAAGLVANETKIDDKTRNAVVAIMEEVARVTPKEGQTFADAWTPVAKEVISKLVAEGKITEGIGTIALGVFGIAVKGIDYIFDVRYPKARQYEELVAAAVSGFTEGFLTVFKPVDSAKSVSFTADEDAVKWLKENASNK